MKIIKILIIIFICFGGIVMADSGSKGKIVFSVQDGIYIIDLDKKEGQLISIKDKGFCWNPTWYNENKVIFRGKLKSSREYNLLIYDYKNNILSKLIEENSPNYPSVSPDKEMLAFSSSIWINSEKKSKRWLSIFYFNGNKKIDYTEVILEEGQTFSWSNDNKLLTLVLEGKRIGIFDINNATTRVVGEGREPLFNPITNELFFIQKNDLNKKYQLIRVHLKDTNISTEIADEHDWYSRQTFSISEDGKFIFYIRGDSRFFMEYSVIESFDLFSKKTRQLSKKYSIIHGANYSLK